MSSVILAALMACSGGETETPDPVAEPVPQVVPDDGVMGGKSPGVSFIGLEDGAKVKSPLKIGMNVVGKEVEPAGVIVEGKGHHHLIIDGEATPLGTAVPADETHIHFGGGQEETEVELTPGEHTLTLQFADGAHLSYGPDWSKTISVTVEP